MKSFAVIPAAGQSVRMGQQHKLLLPWNGRTVMDHVLEAWSQSQADRIVMVVRSDDTELQSVGENWPRVEMVMPHHPPADMRSSVQLGLRQLRAVASPTAGDRWLVAPADLPTLGHELIDDVVTAGRHATGVIVPRFGERRGHPVSFPWSMVDRVFELPADRGINSLIEDDAVEWLDLPPDEHPDDIDTPEEYSRAVLRQSLDHGETGSGVRPMPE